MFYNCTKIKVSFTQTGEYTTAYRIPASGTGTDGEDSRYGMFTSTGGTFKGTPKINTTYYLSSENMVVYETDVATLNGYVGVMIDSITSDDLGAAPSDHTHTSLTLTDLTVNGSTKMNSATPLSLTSGGTEYGAISVDTSVLQVGTDDEGNLYTSDANKLIIRGPSTLCVVGNPENDVALYVDRHRIAFVGDPICTYDAANKQYVDLKIGDISSILDSINGEVI